MPRPQTRAAAFQAAGRSLKVLSRPVNDGPRHRPTLGQRLALDRETRPPVGISLAPVTLTALSDVDVGLVEDHAAQAEAERFIRATLFNNAKRAEREAAARRLFPGKSIHVVVADDSLALIAPRGAAPPRQDAVAVLAQRWGGNGAAGFMKLGP